MFFNKRLSWFGKTSFAVVVVLAMLAVAVGTTSHRRSKADPVTVEQIDRLLKKELTGTRHPAVDPPMMVIAEVQLKAARIIENTPDRMKGVGEVLVLTKFAPRVCALSCGLPGDPEYVKNVELELKKQDGRWTINGPVVLKDYVPFWEYMTRRFTSLLPKARQRTVGSMSPLGLDP